MEANFMNKDIEETRDAMDAIEGIRATLRQRLTDATELTGKEARESGLACKHYLAALSIELKDLYVCLHVESLSRAAGMMLVKALESQLRDAYDEKEKSRH